MGNHTSDSSNREFDTDNCIQSGRRKKSKIHSFHVIEPLLADYETSSRQLPTWSAGSLLLPEYRVD